MIWDAIAEIVGFRKDIIVKLSVDICSFLVKIAHCCRRFPIHVGIFEVNFIIWESVQLHKVYSATSV